MSKEARKTVFPWRFFYRTLIIQAALIMIAVFASGLVGRSFFKKYFLRQVESQMQDGLVLLSHTLAEGASNQWCEREAHNTNFRLALLRVSGEVICDAQDLGDSVDANLVVKQALENPPGGRIAYKVSDKVEMSFGALKSNDGKYIIRGAVPLVRLSNVTRVFDTSLFFFLTLIALVLGVAAAWSARQLVFPLGRVLLKTESLISRQPDVLTRDELHEETFGEWSDLESNIDSIRKNLEKTTQSLRREQVELHTVMAAISDAILAVNLDGVPLFYNSRFEIVFGPQPREGQGRLWEIFRDPEILGAFEKALKEGKHTETKAISIEVEGAARGYFTLAVSPLRKQGDVIYGALGIFHNVTELKTAEQMRIDFVANVSHELRTPLTAIKGYAETLIDDLSKNPALPRDTHTEEFLKIIYRNSNRLMNIMEDLLDLSSLESSLILQKDAVDTTEVTERILKQLSPNFLARNQTIEKFIHAKTVNADPNRLEQVLTNLLDNANKYTPFGGTISVSWEAEGRNVLLKVSDTGPGIPGEHHSRLFERFYRVDKARSREQGGTGLGLAIVKHIMQRHEGTVWVESKPGQGATFICRFPEISA